MMIDEFIQMENPQKEGIDFRKDLLQLIDELYIDPLERELMRRNLEYNILADKDLPYRADLIKEYVEYHMENEQLPILIEIFGMNNVPIDALLENFIKIMPAFSFAYYEPDIQGIFKKGIVGMSKKYLYIHKTNIKDFRQNHIINIGDNEERARRKLRRNASLKLEYLGEWKKDEGTIVSCIIYDRNFGMHGYVSLKI